MLNREIYLSIIVDHMVRTLNVPMDDKNFENVKEIKERRGLTWEDFLLKAVSVYESRINEKN